VKFGNASRSNSFNKTTKKRKTLARSYYIDGKLRRKYVCHTTNKHLLLVPEMHLILKECYQHH